MEWNFFKKQMKEFVDLNYFILSDDWSQVIYVNMGKSWATICYSRFVIDLGISQSLSNIDKGLDLYVTILWDVGEKAIIGKKFRIFWIHQTFFLPRSFSGYSNTQFGILYIVISQSLMHAVTSLHRAVI